MNFLPRKLESWGRFRDPSLRSFHSVRACDRWTDGQTDGIPIVASTGLAQQSYATVAALLTVSETFSGVEVENCHFRPLYCDCSPIAEERPAISMLSMHR